MTDEPKPTLSELQAQQYTASQARHTLKLVGDSDVVRVAFGGMQIDVPSDIVRSSLEKVVADWYAAAAHHGVEAG